MIIEGTVVWTSPSGKVYTTTPGGALFFPALALSTGELEVAYTNGPHPTKRGLMMPTRRRTRTQDAPTASPWNANTTSRASAAEDSCSLHTSPATTNPHPSEHELDNLRYAASTRKVYLPMARGILCHSN